MKGLIFDIRRFSVHDGPGIRTTVFMKGCPLSCWWCHNPESRLAGCETYTESHKLDGREFRNEKIIGKEIDSTELLEEIKKDLVFMNESNGGVSFSGGEPLFQPDFLEQMLRECCSANIHTVVDTSGYASPACIERILPFTGLFLYDLKAIDDELHSDYTGVSNISIIDNLRLITEARKRIWIRLPLIEDVNDKMENLKAIADLLHSLAGRIELINILPYHTIGKSKYNKFGKENRMGSMKNYPVFKSEKILKFFIDEGFNTKIGG